MTNGRWYSRAQCFWRIKRYALCWLSYPCIRCISYWLRNVNTNFHKQMKRSVWESIVYRKLLTWTLPTRQIPTWTIPTHTLSIQEIIHHHLAHPNTSIQNKIYKISSHSTITTLIARFMGPTRCPPGADRTQVGPMLAQWSLLSGNHSEVSNLYMYCNFILFCRSNYPASWIFFLMRINYQPNRCRYKATTLHCLGYIAFNKKVNIDQFCAETN